VPKRVNLKGAATEAAGTLVEAVAARDILAPRGAPPHCSFDTPFGVRVGFPVTIAGLPASHERSTKSGPHRASAESGSLAERPTEMRVFSPMASRRRWHGREVGAQLVHDAPFQGRKAASTKLPARIMRVSRAVCVLATSATVLAALIAVLPASAATATLRFPLIGCGLGHYELKYAPTGYCETGGSLGAREGIDHAHWKHWGQSRATADGFLVDGHGFEYQATITAYDLISPAPLCGAPSSGTSEYLYLHVVANGGRRKGMFRGPFNVKLNVEIDC
jgi:hypothetical protein